MATVIQKFGAKIKRLRKAKKLTQEKLAEMAKVDYSYLNLIENGNRNPSLKLITKLARVLSTPLEELMKLK